MSPGPAARLWPSVRQELLLRAVFAPDAEAQGAWDELRSSFDLDRLEEGSYALMPIFGRRLAEWNTDAELATRLRGLYRHAWYRGNVLLERTKELLGVAEEQGTAVLVTGEPRLLLQSYRDPGLRPATRIDFLVQQEDRTRFAVAIEQAGWTPARSNMRTVWLEREGGPAVSLRLAPADVWAHAGGAPAATSATDELLRICTGEERRFPWHRLQWIADADALLGSEAESVDWERLLAAAAAARVTLHLRDALGYLRGRTAAPVPGETLALLAHTRAGARERLARLAGR